MKKFVAGPTPEGLRKATTAWRLSSAALVGYTSSVGVATAWHDKIRGMAEVKYVARVRIERVRGPLRRAHLPAEPAPVLFGVHDEVAEHYGVRPETSEPHATTLDYVVAAAAG